jgi:hypothetical protein
MGLSGARQEREKVQGMRKPVGLFFPQLVLTDAHQFGLIMFSDFPMLEPFGGPEPSPL